VIAEILPKPRHDSICSAHLARCFNCGSTHVHKLIQARAICAQRAKRGETDAVPVCRASVERFLKAALVR
jgi:hypothetical protein